MSTLTVAYKHPSDTSSIIKNTAQPPHTSPPSQVGDKEEYLCGDLSPYQGANPGQDQDRVRVDNSIPAGYNYPSGASGSELENESAVTEGY